MDVDRILRKTPATLTVTFYGDANPLDADSTVTVSVYRPDGTLHLSQNATKVGSAGSGQYKLDLPGQTELRLLRLEWTGEFSGDPATLTTYAEIVGGFYFTLYEARHSDILIEGNLLKYTDEMLEEGRLFVETEFERICARAFVPRGTYEKLTGGDSPYIAVENPEVTKINSLKVDGVDWTSRPVRTDGSRTLQLVGGDYFPYSSYGQNNIEIEYEYGQDFVPPDIKRAALKRLRSVVIGQTGRIDERATVMTIPDQGSFTLATPGMRGSLTGLPEVDVILRDWQWAGGISFG